MTSFKAKQTNKNSVKYNKPVKPITISFQIFGANEERVSPPLYAVFVFFLYKIHAFLKL